VAGSSVANLLTAPVRFRISAVCVGAPLQSRYVSAFSGAVVTFQSESDASAEGRTPPYVVDGTPVWPDTNRIGETHVEPKRMDVLLLLIEAAPDVVPLERLLARVWRNVVVGDGVVHQAISHLRRALHDDPRAPRCIETIPRRGYRLVADVVRGPAR
jgi:DNA-binding response OmpR family regulator